MVCKSPRKALETEPSLSGSSSRRTRRASKSELSGRSMRKPAREHLEEQDAQGVDVAPRVDGRRLSGDLLRAHVGERAEELTGARLQGGELYVGVGHARDAEVEDLRLALLVDEDVLGLEVAVDDPFLVRVVDGIADLGDELQPLPRAQAAARRRSR